MNLFASTLEKLIAEGKKIEFNPDWRCKNYMDYEGHIEKLIAEGLIAEAKIFEDDRRFINTIDDIYEMATLEHVDELCYSKDEEGRHFIFIPLRPEGYRRNVCAVIFQVRNGRNDALAASFHRDVYMNYYGPSLSYSYSNSYPYYLCDSQLSFLFDPDHTKGDDNATTIIERLSSSCKTKSEINRDAIWVRQYSRYTQAFLSADWIGSLSRYTQSLECAERKKRGWF